MTTMKFAPMCSGPRPVMIERCDRCEVILTGDDLALPMVVGRLQCQTCNPHKESLDLGFETIHAPDRHVSSREWVRRVRLTEHDHYLLKPTFGFGGFGR